MQKTILIFASLSFLLLGCQENNKKDASVVVANCDCPLELIYTNTTYKDSVSVGNFFNIEGEAQLNAELAKAFSNILRLELDAGIKEEKRNEKFNTTETTKTLKSDLPQEIIEAYLSERELFCAKYRIICNDKTIPDSLRTSIFLQEIDRLTEELRKIRNQNQENKNNTSDKGGISKIESQRKNSPLSVNGDNNKVISAAKTAEINEINAPNALIVTKDQTGGNNTVITSKVDLPPPKIELKKWEIKNKQVTKLEGKRPRDTIFIPNEKIQEQFLFHNKFVVSYYSEASRNEISLIIKRNDIIHSTLKKSGVLNHRFGQTKEGWHGFIIQQPQNGEYIFNVYTRESIQDILKEINYLK